jgi:hypothetical protein
VSVSFHLAGAKIRYDDGRNITVIQASPFDVV